MRVPSVLAVVRATRALSRAMAELRFSAPVYTVYNPLEYAWEPHRDYVTRFAGGPRKVLLMGMNPGPWGMSQTGVPFGEISAVRDFLGIKGRVKQPAIMHPKRPVEGFTCTRSEVSGRRLWGLLEQRFGTPESFFKDHYLTNYCPLAFMAESGANITPDKIPFAETALLYAACDTYLRSLIRIMQPEVLIGVGKFAEQVLRRVAPSGVRVMSILHPSPASPAANADWAGQVTRTLEEAGVW